MECLKNNALLKLLYRVQSLFPCGTEEIIELTPSISQKCQCFYIVSWQKLPFLFFTFESAASLSTHLHWKIINFSVEVDVSRNMQCEVTLHFHCVKMRENTDTFHVVFSTGQNLLKKILRKDKYWQSQLKSFLIDLLIANNAMYHNSLTLNNSLVNARMLAL